MIIPFFVLTMVFKHVKAAGMFSMRHSHQETDSTWNTTWFSTFWRQQISSTVTATNAAFVNRVLQRDPVFQQDGPYIAKAPPYPRFYYYDPKLNRRSCNYRIRLDQIILPNCKETTTNSIKLRFDESSRTSLTGLSVLLRNAGTPIQPGIKLAKSSTVSLSDLLSVFFPSFSFLYHTSTIFFLPLTI